MENFDQFLHYLPNMKGIGLNTDILETGLINIFCRNFILYWSRLLGSLLEERKTTIVKGVQDAEDRLNEAKKRLVKLKNN
jgi:hypothetical protein